MTLHATRDGQAITIHGNTGTNVVVTNGHVQHVQITETVHDVRRFHAELGKLLDEADAERSRPEPEPQHAEHGTPHGGHGHHGGYGTGAPEHASPGL